MLIANFSLPNWIQTSDIMPKHSKAIAIQTDLMDIK